MGKSPKYEGIAKLVKNSINVNNYQNIIVFFANFVLYVSIKDNFLMDMSRSIFYCELTARKTFFNKKLGFVFLKCAEIW